MQTTLFSGYSIHEWVKADYMCTGREIVQVGEGILINSSMPLAEFVG